MSAEQPKEVSEIVLMRRLRLAISDCKRRENLTNHTIDLYLPDEDRMKMERCLIQQYLIPKGMDYFGKRDFIFLDMIGQDDIKNISGHDFMGAQ
jgi:hypothetical protein